MFGIFNMVGVSTWAAIEMVDFAVEEMKTMVVVREQVVEKLTCLLFYLCPTLIIGQLFACSSKCELLFHRKDI